MYVSWYQYQLRDQEVKANRLSAHDVQRLQEEVSRQQAEERKAREEKTRKKTPESACLRHMEEVRWEGMGPHFSDVRVKGEVKCSFKSRTFRTILL